jgi:hypothetical protein
MPLFVKLVLNLSKDSGQANRLRVIIYEIFGSVFLQGLAMIDLSLLKQEISCERSPKGGIQGMGRDFSGF